MFVVKDSPDRDVFSVIAGEMLNRENSIKHFENGVPYTEMPQDYVGYPAFSTGGKKYTLKAVSGSIYIPNGFEKEKFVRVINDAIEELKIVRLDDKPVTSQCSHTASINYCTVVLQDVPASRGFSIKPGEKLNVTSTRFIWHIHHFSEIDTEVNGNNPELAITRMSGIFWDSENILKLEHGINTFYFGKDSFKASEFVTGEKLILFNNENPLLFALSKYWSEADSSTDAKSFMRDINVKKLVGATVDQIAVKPVRTNEESDDTSTDICYRCKEPLYGDVYGLCGYISKQDEPITTPAGKIIITPMCPLCLHTTPEESPLEQRYIRVLRIKWGRSIEDAINASPFSDQRKNIFHEALKGVKSHETKLSSGPTVQFYLIGDKYAGFGSISDYQYNALVNAPLLSGRKICKVQMIA